VEGKNEDVANRVATDVFKFFDTTPHTSHATHTDIILNTTTLVEYIHTLKQQGKAPSTIIDKLRNLRLFIEYLSTDSSQNIGKKCDLILKWLQKRAKTLRKDLKKQQMVNALRGEHEVDNATNPKDFWNNDKVKGDVNTILHKAECNINITTTEHSTVLAYLAANLMYKNSQRPGVVENMTIKEYTNRRNDENKAIIRVLKHKTAASTGPANIVVDTTCMDTMSRYYQYIRTRVSAQSEELGKLFFLTSSGNSFKKISETIQKVAERYSVIVPTASLHRKVVKTAAHCHELTEGKMRALNRHMSHSDATSSKFYQLPAAKKAVDVYNTITILSNKRFFTPQEDKLLLKEWPLNKAKTPSLELCRHIIERHELPRTDKQLQDRWITLSKNAI